MGRESNVTEEDIQRLARGELDGAELDRLERFVIDTARDDVAPSAAKARLLASPEMMGSEPPREPPIGRMLAGRTGHLVGLSLLVGVALVGSTMTTPSGRDDAHSEASPLRSPPTPSTQESAPAEPSLPAPPVATTPQVQEASKQEPAVVRKVANGRSPTRGPAEPSMVTPSPASSASLHPDELAPSTLDREVARMTSVRAALAAGEAERALQGLAAYEAEFPAGAFTIEVSVLRIEALVRSGRAAEARDLGARFLAQHPSGASARRVTLSLQSITPMD